MNTQYSQEKGLFTFYKQQEQALVKQDEHIKNRSRLKRKKKKCIYKSQELQKQLVFDTEKRHFKQLQSVQQTSNQNSLYIKPADKFLQGVLEDGRRNKSKLFKNNPDIRVKQKIQAKGQHVVRPQQSEVFPKKIKTQAYSEQKTQINISLENKELSQRQEALKRKESKQKKLIKKIQSKNHSKQRNNAARNQYYDQNSQEFQISKTLSDKSSQLFVSLQKSKKTNKKQSQKVKLPDSLPKKQDNTLPIIFKHQGLNRQQRQSKFSSKQLKKHRLLEIQENKPQQLKLHRDKYSNLLKQFQNQPISPPSQQHISFLKKNKVMEYQCYPLHKIQPLDPTKFTKNKQSNNSKSKQIKQDDPIHKNINKKYQKHSKSCKKIVTNHLRSDHQTSNLNQSISLKLDFQQKKYATKQSYSFHYSPNLNIDTLNKSPAFIQYVEVVETQREVLPDWMQKKRNFLKKLGSNRIS